jgi:hypothetical protein
MKRTTCKSFGLAAVTLIVLAFSSSGALIAAPVFSYQFASTPPTSWDGVGGSGSAVTDLSAAGHNAVTAGTPALSTNVPAGAPANANSLNTATGGLRTNDPSLLTNALIAANGGFTMDVWVYWDGSDNTQHIGKIIDYAGTDYLQLQDIVLNTSANIRFGFNDNTINGPHLITTSSININQWYHVVGTFDTGGNAVAGDGSITGTATLTIDGNVIGTDTVTKIAVNGALGTAGDALNRRIGVGSFNTSATGLLLFRGNLYNPSVSLVPEPFTAILLGFAAAMCSFVRRRDQD